MKKVMLSIMLFVGRFVDGQEAVKCGSQAHWEQWIKAGSKLSSSAQDQKIHEVMLYIVKAQGEYFTALKHDDGKSIGVRAYEQLELFGKKLENKFNCSDGLSWVEQMMQTERAFDCGTHDCSK